MFCQSEKMAETKNKQKGEKRKQNKEKPDFFLMEVVLQFRKKGEFI